MSDKQIYELINMSDTITFYALDEDYARAVTLLLGEGKCGCRTKDGRSLEYCFTAFHGEAPQEIYDKIERMLKEKDTNLIEALNSVAVCNFAEREIFDEYTENATNEAKWLKWDDAHRTSLNNFGKYARKLAKNIFNNGQKAS